MNENTELSPDTHTTVDGVDRILPFKGRGLPFASVSFSSTSNIKQKSRIASQSKCAVFNFRPLKRGEKPVQNFRPPDATLPSLNFMSPWLSASTDNIRDRCSPYRDGQSTGLAGYPMTSPLVAFQRSNTDMLPVRTRMIDFPSKFEHISNAKANTMTDSLFSRHREARITTETQKMSVDMSSVTKATVPNRNIARAKPVLVGSVTRSPVPEEQQTTPDIRPNSRELSTEGLNTSSGCSSQEGTPRNVKRHSTDEIQTTINEADDQMNVDVRYPITYKQGHYYKPLVGDRSLFIKESYPTSPKIYQSDIDHVRSAGHDQLHVYNGQWSDNFSILNKAGTKHRPLRKALTLNEARREQTRQTVSARNPRRRYMATMLARGERLV